MGLTNEAFSQCMDLVCHRWPFPPDTREVEAVYKQMVWNACQLLDEQAFIQAVIDLEADKKQYGRPSPEQLRLRGGGAPKVVQQGDLTQPARTEEEFVERTGWTKAEMRAYWHKNTRPKLDALGKAMQSRARILETAAPPKPPDEATWPEVDRQVREQLSAPQRREAT